MKKNTLITVIGLLMGCLLAFSCYLGALYDRWPGVIAGIAAYAVGGVVYASLAQSASRVGALVLVLPAAPCALYLFAVSLQPRGFLVALVWLGLLAAMYFAAAAGLKVFLWSWWPLRRERKTLES